MCTCVIYVPYKFLFILSSFAIHFIDLMGIYVRFTLLYTTVTAELMTLLECLKC